ncbi:MAG: SGNH/GDSL hydrolase family protein [Planctomycetes bacterium]|nr:SGNH/GDSL hydrolase family protein [Planctomycetota bacterium]
MRQTNKPESPRRGIALVRAVIRALGVAIVLFVLTLEIGSRVCDGIVESRRQDPESFAEMTKRTHEPDLAEKICFGALEYGTVVRAWRISQNRSAPHPYLGYALRPNFVTAPEEELQASHNSLGRRGKETTWAKPAGVYRIVTAGGSSVYGQSESCDAAVWSQRLEDYLNAQGGGRKFEVINLGVPGWTSFEMLIDLQLRGLEFDPDLVIVYEAINDMRAALYTGGGAPMRDNTHWRAPWPADRPSDLEEWLGHSRTYLVWRRYLTNYLQLRGDLAYYGVRNFAEVTGDTFVHLGAGRPIPDVGFDSYRRNLENMITATHKRGAKLLIVTQALPRWHLDNSPESLADQTQSFVRIQNIQREVANARGVPLFECADVVEKAVDAQLAEERNRHLAADPNLSLAAAEHLARQVVGKKQRGGLFYSEVHPNDSGSDLIGRLVAEYLQHSSLLH